MPYYTVSLTDQQAACVTAELTRPSPEGTRGSGDIGVWLQTNVTRMAQACVEAVAARNASNIGITSTRDLTAADIAALKAARGL